MTWGTVRVGLRILGALGLALIALSPMLVREEGADSRLRPIEPIPWSPGTNADAPPHFGSDSGSMLYVIGRLWGDDHRLWVVSPEGSRQLAVEYGTMCRGARVDDVLCHLLPSAGLDFAVIGSKGWTHILDLGRQRAGFDLNEKHLVASGHGRIHIYERPRYRWVHETEPLADLHGAWNIAWARNGVGFAAQSIEVVDRENPDRKRGVQVAHGRRGSERLDVFSVPKDEDLFSGAEATPLDEHRGRWIVGFRGGVAACDPGTSDCEVRADVSPELKPRRGARVSEKAIIVLMQEGRGTDERSHLYRLDLEDFTIEHVWTPPHDDADTLPLLIWDLDWVPGTYPRLDGETGPP